MLLPGPDCVNGSLYALPLLQSPSPSTLPCCHLSVSSHHCSFCHGGLGSIVLRPIIGCWQLYRSSHCLLQALAVQARNLPWAPCTALLNAAARLQSVCHGSLY
ncbi:unnamed protein product, partial [Staurois parvus]